MISIKIYYITVNITSHIPNSRVWYFYIEYLVIAFKDAIGREKSYQERREVWE